MEIEGLGHCGGLLIVSHLGRPIEFHCSAPVVTNRAQKILYGKTYDHYLYCEQIGLSLIDKSKTKPPLIFADSIQLLGLENLTSELIVGVDPPGNARSKAMAPSTECLSIQANRTGNVLEIHAIATLGRAL